MRFFTYASPVNKGKLFNLIYRVGIAKGLTNTGHYEHTYDIMRAALNGTFDVNQEEFNHNAYENTSSMNDNLNRRKEVTKKSNIVDDTAEEGVDYGYGDVKAGVALKVKEDAFGKVDSIETIDPSFDALFSVRDRVKRELGIDIVVSLEASLGEDPDAILAMRELVQKDPDAHEIVMDLLESATEINSSGEEFDFLEALKMRREDA